MDHYLVWVWLGCIVLSVIAEVLTEQLVAIWFLPGALVAAVLAVCDVPVIWQIFVFVLITAVGILLSRTLIYPRLTAKNAKTNIDAIIGQKCVVTEEINNFVGCGQAKVNGQYWSARGVNEDDVFPVGTKLSIVAIEGVKLICRK